MEATNYYGQIELTVLSDIVRKHPNLVKVVTGKDGKTRKYIGCHFQKRQNPSNYGHTHYMKVAVKKDERQADLNYYIGDFKSCQQQERTATAADVEDTLF